jgi:GH18 family chitinase
LNIADFDFPEQANYLDWISLLAVDATGFWNKVTGYGSLLNPVVIILL